MLETLKDLLDLLDLTNLADDAYRGAQPDTPNHHIVGGQIAAQALMAACRTVDARRPHSLHVYFLRRGDARGPVEFVVERLHDGGTFSTREITASQSGVVLMKALASFTADVESVAYHVAMPTAPTPESLQPVEDQLAPYAHEFGGWWVQSRPFDMRYVDPPPRIAMELGETSGAIRIWLRARGLVPNDPMVGACVLTYLTALTLLEPALGPMGKSLVDVSALLDHTIWFHRLADFSDWLLFDQTSPNGVGARALATGSLFNGSGELVCTAAQEGYFPAQRAT
jgi:acyl-CoA thioesterase-2